MKQDIVSRGKSFELMNSGLGRSLTARYSVHGGH